MPAFFIFYGTIDPLEEDDIEAIAVCASQERAWELVSKRLDWDYNEVGTQRIRHPEKIEHYAHRLRVPILYDDTPTTKTKEEPAHDNSTAI